MPARRALDSRSPRLAGRTGSRAPPCIRCRAQAPCPVRIGESLGAPVPAAPVQPPARDRRPGENERGTAAIRGQVVAADTGAPLRRAAVRAFSQGGGGTASRRPTRRALRDHAAAGRPLRRLRACGAATSTCSSASARRTSRARPLEFADGQALDKVNFALPSGGAISGRIVDELGEPLASVRGARCSATRTWADRGGSSPARRGGRQRSHRRPRTVPPLRPATRRVLRCRHAPEHGVHAA